MSGTTEGAGRSSSSADPSKSNFLIVGLGGSAGAITSFREFFRHVPPDSGMAYVVILHLSPEHESKLAEVLQGAATIPVHQVRETVHVEPDQVYVIPPNKNLTLSDGMLVLSDIISFEQRRAPVDIFFRTLADHIDSRAVAVVMSGSGADGSMGVRRVKEYNGLVLVQDPSEAGFGEMPQSSIATGLVDFVLPVADMPRRIINYRDQLANVRVAEDDEERRDGDERALIEIFTLLRVRTGQDFSNYKRATVLRRIERRLAVHDLATLAEYARFLADHADEPGALVRELLISVTNFFRDREVWEKFETTVIPMLLQNKRADDHLRIWVPGCATGEEAYSIAMLLAERPGLPDVQIFATDLDEHAIARARMALYNEADVADVPPERLRRFFVREQDRYRVRREVREMVLFAQHNLIKDPPFSHLDLISCRNLLIYLNRSAQQRALEVLHFALEPGGYLLLGTAESVDAAAAFFITLDKEAHLYQSRAIPRVVTAPQPPIAAPGEVRSVISLHAAADARFLEPRARDRLAPIDLHQRLLEQYAPPSLIVDDEYNIVHLSDHAGKYLQFTGGEASTNVLHLIRPELRMDLRSALVQAAQKRTAVAARGLSVQTGEKIEKVDVLVRPALSDGDPTRGCFLVLFEEARETDRGTAAEAAVVEPGARQIEEELLRVKSQMRVTIEQYEVQAEEAKAANEELQAMNEELRSTAEELETSQEELQSVNEELQTVNQELKVKIDEIGHANDDLRNLMSSTEIGTVFVDRSLRVKLFTPRVRDIFNLITTDVGRPLLDITNRLAVGDLSEVMGQVLERLQTIEREVQTREGAWYLMRLLPYRTSEDRIDGVVLTFVDISGRKQAEEAQAAELSATRILHELTLRVAPETSADIVHHEVVSAAIRLGRAQAGSIQLLDGDRLLFLAAEGLPPALTEHLQSIDAASTTSSGVAIATGRRTFVDYDDPQNDDRDGIARLHREAGFVTAQSTPLVARDGRIVGTLTTHWRERGRRPSENDLRHLDLLARHATDLLDRQRAGAELRESRARLQAIANLVPDLLWMSEADGRTSWFNERWLAYTGQTLEEATGWGWKEAIHPDDREEAAALYRQSVNERRPLQQERRIRGASGEYRWFLLSVQPFAEAGGDAIRYYGAATDVHEQRMAREELEQRVRLRTRELEELSAQRQVLLNQLVSATEVERQRIARELHDEMGQHITALRIGLEGLHQASPAIDQMTAIVGQLDAAIDRLAHELRPPALDDLGLHGAVVALTDRFSTTSGLKVSVHSEGVDGERFGDAVETTIYRVVQEALTNAWKHANARTVSVIITRERDSLGTIVEDDGDGFDTDGKIGGDANAFGLLGMRERLALVRGTLEIESEKGSGTTIYARVPLDGPPPPLR